ncbi:MAG: hypothetical protein V3573_14440 [Desulfovibrionaceae bacterium]
MKRFILILLFALLMPLQALAAYNVWLDNSLTKYRQDGEDGTSGASTLTLGMARNEIESFQVLIYANGETLTNVDVTVSNFVKGADSITDIYLYKQDYVACTQKSRIEFELGNWPDALLPKVDRYYHEVRNTFPFSVANGKVQGVWVDVGTEAATVPGTYSATVTISADGKPNVLRTVTLNVWDFALPSTPTLQYQMINKGGQIATGFGFSSYLNTSYFRDLTAVCNKLALYHKVSFTMTNWVSFYTRFSWDTGTKTLSNITWSPWDTIYTTFVDGSAITSGPYAGARFAIIGLPGTTTSVENNVAGITTSDKQSAARQYLQLFYDKIDALGGDAFNTLVVATLDEPQATSTVIFRDQEMFEVEVTELQLQDAAAINTHGKGPFVRGYSNTSKRDSTLFVENYGFHSQWFANVACYQSDTTCSYSTPKQRDLYTAANWWLYLGCASNGCGAIGDSAYSNQVDLSADAPMYYNRFPGFVLAKYEATGSTYWHTMSECSTTEGNNPYNNIWSNEYKSNGDGHLVYPGVADTAGRAVGAETPAIGGTHDIPVESIRLKAVRDFVEDYEYAHILQSVIGKEAMLLELNRFFTTTDLNHLYWNLNKDMSQFDTNRAALAQLITSSEPVVIHTEKSFRAGNKHFRVGPFRAFIGD